MAGGGGGEGSSLEYTPSWIVALVCTVIVAISLVAERLLHYAGKFLVKKNQGALFLALQKIKEELMLLGFISLLMTVFQNRITNICIAKHLTDDWLPCNKSDKSKKSTYHFQSSFLVLGRRLLAAAAPPPDGPGYCEKKGKVPLLSYKAVHDLHIFIFVLAVVHVVFSALTILFGTLKIRQWKQWEDSIQKKEYDPELGWHAYFWIAFIPLILLLIVGTKLEHIITQLAEEVGQRHTAITGDLVVRPSDDHFWFHKPRLVLVLIHIILFQNSFEIAVFFWMLVVFKFDSCIMGEVGYVIPRLVIGVLVQLLCSYSTLPLYAIVAQMGSSFNRAIFEDHIQVMLTKWAEKAKKKKAQRKAADGSIQVGHKESLSNVQPPAVGDESRMEEGKALEIEPTAASNEAK